ncbi:hypothetical protein [Amycolatopsis vastitatis]|uniref:hypothetical protein n=1 Tax=Amycolatopsis vastitatis TaxID=1905142 RepID=UPI0013043F11|nr:hypothetical protein [Amycolatopsis vastitatis]
MDLGRNRRARLRLDRLLSAWCADVRSVDLPKFDPARVDAVVRELRARRERLAG